MIRYWFTIVEGPEQGRTLELEHGITVLGRLADKGETDPPGSRRWLINDPAVSRTHCAIQWLAQGPPQLAHFSKTNNTLVNGQPIQQAILEPDFVLQIGLTSLQLKREEIADGPGWEENNSSGWGASAEESGGGWGASEATLSDGWNPT